MFNLYFAGVQCKEADELIIERKACRLLSYLNDQTRLKTFQAIEDKGLLFVDSGAFSVHHNNKTVDIDHYIEYVNNAPNTNWFAQLDVIPYPLLDAVTVANSCKKSWENYLYMQPRLKNPFKVLPVYHFGEPPEALLQLVNHKIAGEQIPYIGIGGRHGVSTKKQEEYFERVFKLIERSSNPNVKVHVFGMTILDTLKKFPFHSADSTSWLLTAAMGGIFTEKYRVISVSSVNNGKNNYQHQTKEAKLNVQKEVEQYGYTIEELSTNYKKRTLYNIEFLLRWCEKYEYTPPPKSFGFISN